MSLSSLSNVCRLALLFKLIASLNGTLKGYKLLEFRIVCLVCAIMWLDQTSLLKTSYSEFYSTIYLKTSLLTDIISEPQTY